MNELLKIAAAAMQAGAMERGAYEAKKLLAVAVIGLLAASFGMGVLGCVTAAIWIYCIPTLGPAIAPLIAAAFLLVLGAAISLTAWSSMKPKMPPPAPRVDPGMAFEQGAQLAAKGVQIANKVFSEHKGAALAAALVAGLVMSNSINTRPPSPRR